MKDEFKEKVQAMTAKEIIMSMVNGLENRHLAINMETFGRVEHGICYGCAATNAICEISQKVFTESSLGTSDLMAMFIGSTPEFMEEFEDAINYLRTGNLGAYNMYAQNWDFSTIKNTKKIQIRTLETATWQHNIHLYKELAESQTLNS